MNRRRTVSWLTTLLLLPAIALGVGGCGADEPEGRPPNDPASTMTGTTDAPADDRSKGPAGSKKDRAAALARRPPGEEGLRVPAAKARLVAVQSEFGRVLFDANGQVVYAFENDRPNRSNCTSDDCVEAWPPVLTRQPPSPGNGVRGPLLGTIRRSDGSLQVTYNGRPLYFYEHEGPGEIRCHNVELHGGLWWVVTPAGDPAA
jgi:predicted lipoprotein with Yx(FWY)xxD motif